MCSISLHQQWPSLTGTKRKKGSCPYSPPPRLAPHLKAGDSQGYQAVSPRPITTLRPGLNPFAVALCSCLLGSSFLQSVLSAAGTRDSASSPMEIQLLNTCTKNIYAHLPWYWVLLFTPHHKLFWFLCSGLQTSFKLHRSKTLLPSMSRMPAVLPGAIAGVLKPHTYTCSCSCSVQKHDTCYLPNCGATEGTYHCCMCQPSFALLD